MTQTQTGWLLFIAALGTMCTLLAGDVKNLAHWGDALDPAFVAGFMTHLGVVIAAFVGGKLLPTADAQAVSNTKRAELGKDVVGV